MKIAVLERFCDPSRRCDSELTLRPEDELTIWNLVGGWEGWRSFLSHVWPLFSEPISIRDRMRLALACFRTGGAQTGALVHAAELLRHVRAGYIESIACYSTKDFALAELLSEQTGTPCRELLSCQTKYFGEFAFELLAVVPYAYWLHCQGRLRRTIGVPDTRCLYYFSEHHEEVPVQRRYVPITEYPLGEHDGPLSYDKAAFPEFLRTEQWTPPPYRDAFNEKRIRWDREICIVSN